eukprot:snap_masked-scaffold_12-processed-gene-3.29-mRNA-1 protein AED:1.00 eAED:1.00 QI:0/0/0/0/1/1/2/0/236
MSTSHKNGNERETVQDEPLGEDQKKIYEEEYKDLEVLEKDELIELAIYLLHDWHEVEVQHSTEKKQNENAELKNKEKNCDSKNKKKKRELKKGKAKQNVGFFLERSRKFRKNVRGVKKIAKNVVNTPKEVMESFEELMEKSQIPLETVSKITQKVAEVTDNINTFVNSFSGVMKFINSVFYFGSEVFGILQMFAHTVQVMLRQILDTVQNTKVKLLGQNNTNQKVVNVLFESILIE